jgi:hypothetical protein
VAQTGTRTLRAESVSLSVDAVESAKPVDAAREFYDDFDFPPTAHPGRELFTFSVFILLIITLLAWGGWKLISLI